MFPNRTARVLGCLALACLAFGLTGCHAKPRPAKPKPVANEQAPSPKAVGEDGKAVDPESVVGPPVLREKIAAARTVGLQPAVRLPAIRSSKPHTSKEAALTDALTVARTELMKQLDQLDPPIHARPWLVKMKTEYVKGEVRPVPPTDEEKTAIKANGLNPNVYWVEIDLELTEDQVQQLRSTERVTDAFRGGAILFAFLAAIYGFLRLDQWTKGYLTMWLGLAAGLAVGGVAMLVLA
ncbi:undecaprenyl-diphosphate phosphatase [Limnoglobus roseus]|nr:undecaprenyl-diphosphate phosphatase [Limnoglobus roseus]